MDRGSLRFMRVLAAMLLVATSAFGQILNGFEWRSIGPAATGGRISDIAVAQTPGKPSEIYVGTASGGIFKSVNEGVSWTPIFDQAGGMMSIGALAVAPSNHAIVWAGTGEANNRQSSSWGDGVYVSTDRGANWRRAGLDETRHIGRIAIHPQDPNTVYVAAAGHLWGPNPERGVFKTTDGGATWRKILYRDEHTGAIDLAMDPRDPNILYAAMYQRQRKGWGFNGGGPGSGIFRTTDGGATWTELKNGIPPGDKGRIGLAVSNLDPRVIFATIEAEQGGLYRSTDSGDTWERLTMLNPRPMYYSRLALDPTNANRVYLLGSNRGLYISDNGGRDFRDVFSAVHGEDHALWVDPTNPNRLIAGGDGGVAISFDAGASWLFRINLPIGQFYTISANHADPFVVCGGLQDNGSWCTPSATNISYGISFKEGFNVGAGDGMYAAFLDDRTLIVSSQNGYAGRLDLDTMQRQSIGPIAPPDRAAEHPPYRWHWTTPFALSHFNPNTVYTGAQVVFRSEDRGASWKPISPDLTAGIDRERLEMMGGPVPPRALSRHDGQANFSALTVIAESPLDRHLIYTGADDGTIQRTRDGGQHWTNLTANVAGLPPMLSISGIAPSKHVAGRVYLSVDGHFNDDYRPYVFVSENYGQTWRPIVTGLPMASVRRVREHPSNPDVLAVGTEMGLYATFDRGEQWRTLGEKLPTVPVYDLLFHEKGNAIVAGTHGRSVWVLDRVEALGGLTRETLTGDARLFPIPPARHANVFTGQFWFGAGEFFAPNPPAGAVVSYYLPDPQPGGVTLSVLDAAGKTVRTLRGPGRQGLNRACWDLRRESALVDPAQPGFGACWPMGRGNAGPLAPAGKYAVALAAGGKSSAKTELIVLPDPRSRLSESERRTHETAVSSAYGLQQQLAPARQTAMTLNSQVAAMRSAVPFEIAERVSREIARVIGQLSGAIGEASRAQFAIDGYEGAPTAEQARALEWAWTDAMDAVNALNRVIRDEMPALYEAAGRSSRWEPVKPVPAPKRATR